jgi:hypothetical protein
MLKVENYGRMRRAHRDGMSIRGKQRHTVGQLYRRLRDEEQYVVGYDQVREYAAAKRPATRVDSRFLNRPASTITLCHRLPQTPSSDPSSIGSAHPGPSSRRVCF